MCTILWMWRLLIVAIMSGVIGEVLESQGTSLTICCLMGFCFILAWHWHRFWYVLGLTYISRFKQGNSSSFVTPDLDWLWWKCPCSLWCSWQFPHEKTLKQCCRPQHLFPLMLAIGTWTSTMHNSWVTTWYGTKSSRPARDSLEWGLICLSTCLRISALSCYLLI